MVKITCVNLSNLQSNSYKGRTGKEYMFHKGSFTEVDDANDALGFLSIDAFDVEGDKSKADVVKQLKAMLGLGENDEPKIEKLPKAVKKEEKPFKFYSAEEIKALNKKAQEEIILSLGSREFPKFEKDRISHILDLQDEYKRQKGI